MKFALIGYGKMGKTIEGILRAQGHTIVAIIDKGNEALWNSPEIKNADVAIEFSQPESAFENILNCFRLNIPVVCGTTGWLEKKAEVERICKEKNQSFFYASNYSIGVNIFFEINKLLARLMNEQNNYSEILILENHHLQKLDAPSGTAISIAEGILGNINRLKQWTGHSIGNPDQLKGCDNIAELPIYSIRENDVPGTHSVKYSSDVDEIEIIHKAYNRLGFANGAISAALWLADKKGCFSMKDLLKL